MATRTRRRPSPPARRCTICGKWLFRAYRRGARVLRRLAEPGELYWSPPCGGWHITSLTPGEFARRQANRLRGKEPDQ